MQFQARLPLVSESYTCPPSLNPGDNRSTVELLSEQVCRGIVDLGQELETMQGLTIALVHRKTNTLISKRRHVSLIAFWRSTTTCGRLIGLICPPTQRITSCGYSGWSGELARPLLIPVFLLAATGVIATPALLPDTRASKDR